MATGAQTAGLEIGRMPGGVKVGGQLKDMRAVYRRRPEDDPKKMSPGQTLMRNLLTTNPDRFLSMMGKLEAEHRARKSDAEARLRGKEVAATPAEPDGGTLVGFHRAEEFLRGLS